MKRTSGVSDETTYKEFIPPKSERAKKATSKPSLGKYDSVRHAEKISEKRIFFLVSNISVVSCKMNKE